MNRARTMADAVIVVALLLFIVGWIALWGYSADWDSEDLGGWEVLALLGLIFIPPFWAGKLIERVVDRG